MMTPAKTSSPRLLLVRHTAVDVSYAGRCYGATDLDLSQEGHAHVHEVAAEIAVYKPHRVYHSGLQRTVRLAQAIAQQHSAEKTAVIADTRLAEMNFGEWEGKSWDAIYAAGHDIARLMHEPETFAAPGGETAFAMRDRVLAWFEGVPRDGITVAVAHGGPIAVLRGVLTGTSPVDWPALMPGLGEIVALDDEQFF